MSSKAILAGLAGTVFAFFGGWVIFGILLMDFYKSNNIVYEGLEKDPPDMVPLVIANLSFSFLLALIFYRWANVKSFASGFVNGLIISFFIVLAFDMSMYAFFNLSTFTFIVVDILLATLFWGVAGGIIGAVLGTGKAE